ncbi:IS5 family transposase [Paraburkholderia sp. Clong3]
MTFRCIASSRVSTAGWFACRMKARFSGSAICWKRTDLAVQMLALVNEILTEKGLMLKAGSAVDATLIAAPSSTKNGSGTRDPEMQSTQKGGNWYFGMKMHISA